MVEVRKSAGGTLDLGLYTIPDLTRYPSAIRAPLEAMQAALQERCTPLTRRHDLWARNLEPHRAKGYPRRDAFEDDAAHQAAVRAWLDQVVGTVRELAFPDRVMALATSYTPPPARKPYGWWTWVNDTHHISGFEPWPEVMQWQRELLAATRFHALEQQYVLPVADLVDRFCAALGWEFTEPWAFSDCTDFGPRKRRLLPIDRDRNGRLPVIRTLHFRDVGSHMCPINIDPEDAWEWRAPLKLGLDLDPARDDFVFVVETHFDTLDFSRTEPAALRALDEFLAALHANLHGRGFRELLGEPAQPAASASTPD